jgi:hypothetical protein
MGDNARHWITVNNTIGGMCLDRVVARLHSVSQGSWRFHVDDDPAHLNAFDIFCDSNSEGLRGYYASFGSHMCVRSTNLT